MNMLQGKLHSTAVQFLSTRFNRPIDSTSRQVFHHKKNCRNVGTTENALKIIGMFASKWMAAPVLLALPPVDVEDGSAVPGLLWLPVQTNLPLIALLELSFVNGEQSNWLDVCILKAPLT